MEILKERSPNFSARQYIEGIQGGWDTNTKKWRDAYGGFRTKEAALSDEPVYFDSDEYNATSGSPIYAKSTSGSYLNHTILGAALPSFVQEVECPWCGTLYLGWVSKCAQCGGSVGRGREWNVPTSRNSGRWTYNDSYEYEEAKHLQAELNKASTLMWA